MMELVEKVTKILNGYVILAWSWDPESQAHRVGRTIEMKVFRTLFKELASMAMKFIENPEG